MCLTYEAFRERARHFSSLFPAARGEVANLLSGAVSIHPDVVAAFGAGPRSHRSPAFEEDLCRLKAGLCALVSAEYVEVLVGSATLGNDAVAAQLSLLQNNGLVVSNGEFGERLVDHASRAGLGFEHLPLGWGGPFDLAPLARRDVDWIWSLACQTATRGL